MKEWPDKGTVNFKDLIEPVKDVLLEAIEKGDKVYKTGIKYHGYDIEHSAQTTSLSPNLALSRINLQYSKKEQDRDVWDAILSIAFQLGFEQGRRHLAEQMDIVDLFIENISTQTKQLSDTLKILLK